MAQCNATAELKIHLRSNLKVRNLLIATINLFYNRLGCKKQTVILDRAGHFPIEELGLKQMERSCIDFLKQHL